MRKKIFTFLLALAASVGMSWAASNGKLSGAFTVDDGKVVYFSQGNLQATYDGSAWTWAFAANQYDYIGNAAANNAINGNGTVAANGTVDLFGWSTSTTFYGIHNSTDNGTYYASFVDWSSNTDLKASLGEDWRTLTSSEWGYLLDWRTTTSGVRYAKATVNGVAGLIILPDNWDEAYHALASTNNPDAGFDDNVISSAEEWTNDLEAHGAVFLPAAGKRSGTNVSEAGSACYYWSATSIDAYTANYMYINDSELSANSFNLLTYGRSVRLVSETAPAPPLQVTEFEVPGSWYHDFTHLTASDFPGFVAASAAEAQAWSGAPASGSSCLIYAFEDDKAKVCYFENGVFSELGTRADRDDIYYLSDQGYQFYYTGTAPVYTLLTTITVQLNGWNTEVIYTDPDVATIATSCDVSAYQAYDPSISGYYVAWRANSPGSNNELLCVLPKEGYTITKVEFTHNNDASNKTTVTNAPFKYDLSYGNNNISKIEVYGEAETPAAPVVVASWESNSECNVVLTSDGKLTVSKLDYDGVMEDMNSYQSKKWRCFSDLITSIEVQEGVTHIGDYAFYNLQNVTSVSLPNSLTSIGDGAFMDCSITGDLVLPENLESIGEKCFSMVPKSLSTISVPASVTSIGKCAFENKGASDKTSTNVLTAINVAAANPNYCSVDGILYSKDMTTLIAYPAGKTNTEYEIPATVTEIKYNALYSCVNITDLTIPAGTSVIEENGGSDIVAFSGCYGLENIHNNATTPQSIYRVLSYWEGQGQDQINLYVPSGLGATYEAADGWKELNIIDPSTPTPQPEPEGDGKLTGAFTINADGDQILFSKGNLQYQASTSTLRFATNQYDLIGDDNSNISDTYTGWIDLFGWGTGDNPAKKSTVDEDYSTFTDWGTNAISNGGNEANLWRTLTRYEWAYLIQTRANAADLKGQATVADVHGYVLLPDSWTLPAGLSFTASPNNWTTNVYTAEQWTQMEAAGAVFLPAAGYREPEIEGVGEKGWYWSSTPLYDIISYHFEFNETTSRVFGGRIYFGQPVRLVTAAPAVAPTDEQVATNEDPENPGTYYYSTFFHGTQNYKLTNDGTQAFIATLSNNDLVLTKIAEGTQVIPANTAVIFRKSGSADPVVLTPTEENGVSVNPDDNSLKGVDAVTTLESLSIAQENCYVLSGTNDYGVGFYRINSENLKAHKAYVIYTGSAAPKRMRFVFNQTTDVESIQPSAVSIQKILENGQVIIIRNGVRYNAAGQIVK